MPTKLYFTDGLSVGLGAGLAATIKPNSVVEIDVSRIPGATPEAELIRVLSRRRGVSEFGPEHLEARQYTLAELLLSKERAERVSPPLSEEAMLVAFARARKLAALRAEFAAHGGVV